MSVKRRGRGARTWRRIRVRVERARASLFFVPAMFVAAAAVAAAAMLRVDLYLLLAGIDLPSVLQTTPDSARSLLSTVASATIGVAGVVFAITLVSIQLAASQFSPRVIPGFLRDSKQQRVMGLAVGTFAYCLIVLRGIKGPTETMLGFTPHAASALSLVLAIVTIMALVAYLDRSAGAMQVGSIVDTLTDETQGRIRDRYPQRAVAAAVPAARAHELVRPGPMTPVAAVCSGWVCDVDASELLEATPRGGMMHFFVRLGAFVAEGETIGEVWPAPADPAAYNARVGEALVIGDSRILLADVAFGIRQLVDIGLRALSPGINDPTTAYDVIVHLGAVMRELSWRDLTSVVPSREDRQLVIANCLTHEDYVNRAFDQIRLAGGEQSAIAVALMQTLGGIAHELERDRLFDRAAAMRWQGSMTLATFEAGDSLPQDVARVRLVAACYGFDAAASRPTRASDTQTG